MIFWLTSGINPALYEAADIERSKLWQKFRHITWPQLSKKRLFSHDTVDHRRLPSFDQAYMLTKGGPGNSTITF